MSIEVVLLHPLLINLITVLLMEPGFFRAVFILALLNSLNFETETLCRRVIGHWHIYDDYLHTIMSHELTQSKHVSIIPLRTFVFRMRSSNIYPRIMLQTRRTDRYATTMPANRRADFPIR